MEFPMRFDDNRNFQQMWPALYNAADTQAQETCTVYEKLVGYKKTRSRIRNWHVWHAF